MARRYDGGRTRGKAPAHLVDLGVVSSSRTFRPAEQVLQAVATAAWLAVPDYTSRPLTRRTARAVVLAAATGAAVLLEWRAPAEQESDEPGEPGAETEVRPVVAAAAIAAGTIGSVGGRRATRAAARRLEARGVRRPWTVVGLGTGAVTLALSAAQARWQHRAAPRA